MADPISSKTAFDATASRALEPTSTSNMPARQAVNITVDFGGGMEVLFSYNRSHKVSLPYDHDPQTQAEKAPTIRYLIKWLLDNLLSDKNRPELFAQGDTVRPGILVLVNDTDWELEGELDYVIQERDNIMFISTLHGG